MTYGYNFHVRSISLDATQHTCQSMELNGKPTRSAGASPQNARRSNEKDTVLKHHADPRLPSPGSDGPGPPPTPDVLHPVRSNSFDPGSSSGSKGKWDPGSSSDSRRSRRHHRGSSKEEVSREEVTAEARDLLERLLQRRLKKTMERIEEEDFAAKRRRHRSYLMAVNSEDEDGNRNDKSDVVKLLEQIASKSKDHINSHRLGGGELPDKPTSKRRHSLSSGDLSSRENSLNDLLEATSGSSRKDHSKSMSDPNVHAVHQALRLDKDLRSGGQMELSIDNDKEPKPQSDILMSSSSSQISHRISRHPSNGENSRISTLSNTSSKQRIKTRRTTQRSSSLFCAGTEVLSFESSESIECDVIKSRKKKSKFKRLKERLVASMSRSKNKTAYAPHTAHSTPKSPTTDKKLHGRSPIETEHLEEHAQHRPSGRIGSVSSRESPLTSKRHSIDAWLRKTRLKLSGKDKPKGSIKAPAPPELPPLVIPKPGSPIPQPPSSDQSVEDMSAAEGAVAAAATPIVRVNDQEETYATMPAEKKYAILDKIATQLMNIGDRYRQSESLASSLASEVEELQAILSPATSRFATTQEPLSEAARANLTALGQSLHDRHDMSINPMLPRSLNQPSSYPLPIQFSYDVFQSYTDKVLGQDQTIENVALLFLLTRESLSLAGRGSSLVSQGIDYTIKYFADKFATFIVDQGGWNEAVYSSCESDMDLD